MCQPKQECPLVPGVPQRLTVPCQLDEHLLQRISRVLLVSSEIQKIREQCLGMDIVQPPEVQFSSHCFHLKRRTSGKNLSKLCSRRFCRSPSSAKRSCAAP